jgi:predicted Rossmann fold nucleotide-binding protein DprA/Smf involved in DNA uptake
LNEIQKKIVLVMNDGVEEINAIHSQTIIEMNILLATLLELELAGKVDSLGGQIYRLAVELDLSTN